MGQFNILAGSLGATQYFPHSCREYFEVQMFSFIAISTDIYAVFVTIAHNLAWEARRHTLMNEMKACTLTNKDSVKTLPDVFCLEELDNYWLFFKDEMAK